MGKIFGTWGYWTETVRGVGDFEMSKQGKWAVDRVC